MPARMLVDKDGFQYAWNEDMAKQPSLYREVGSQEAKAWEQGEVAMTGTAVSDQPFTEKTLQVGKEVTAPKVDYVPMPDELVVVQPKSSAPLIPTAPPLGNTRTMAGAVQPPPRPDQADRPVTQQPMQMPAEEVQPQRTGRQTPPTPPKPEKQPRTPPGT